MRRSKCSHYAVESCRGEVLITSAASCIHCKTCDIKVPAQDIDWYNFALFSHRRFLNADVHLGYLHKEAKGLNML